MAALGAVLLAACGHDSGEQPGAEDGPEQTRSAAPPASKDTSPADLDDDLAEALEAEPDELEPLVTAATEHDVDPDLVAALAWHESRWDQSARSEAGAVGVMQVMPSTAERVSERLDQPLDPTDVEDNATAGAAYLAGLETDFDSPRQALIAYNMGSERLREEGPLADSEEFADRVLDTRDDLAQVDWEP